jgi:hypothetical protein
LRSFPERETRIQSTWLKPFSSGTLLRRPSALTWVGPQGGGGGR